MTFTCSYFHTLNCADCMNHTFALNKFDAASTATECNQLVKAYIILYYIILYYIILYYIILYDMIWYDMIYDMIWYDMIW
jgi:hypothetical protein